jgi:hypothetical protein
MEQIAAIFKRSFHFTKDVIVQRKNLYGIEEDVRTIEAETRVRVSLIPQVVPEWCTKTKLWEVAKADGNIVVVGKGN